MADWVTISSLATAGGTLALAVATFVSTRTANRSARIAEIALQEQRRPVLVNSRIDDQAQTIGYADGHWLDIPGGGAAVEVADDAAFLAVSLRNAGAGIAVLQAWYGHDRFQTGDVQPKPVEEFRRLTRDQYIAGGDVGFFQGAVRDPDDPLLAALAEATAEGRGFSIDLLYTDQVGGQRTISRFGVQPGQDGGWVGAASRHWYLDAPAPR